ncbi:LysR family transcriptional regulator [Gluconacetobacter tumulisoli]|uniref:LysR family transcriptional regulator n=1 Tax=Gluconacetobacter tumulisoli TaxID=1286189 RepID=A0A7W4PLM2_9PROT|nr:LysR family transcriptional regulator [Gluconacetobacter tumulisoli]MBB2202657.1 LysR family transcriptional regulator [Gluconacetobacter tumulisoli]
MDFRRLRHFETLYRLKSFRLAADELSLTHSALSKSLRKLEEELDLTLFDRTTRSVVPTRAADQLAGQIVRMIHEADLLTREARMLRGASMGALVVGAEPVSMDTLVPRALATLAAGLHGSAHEGVRPTVQVGDERGLVDRLLLRTIDLVVLGGLDFSAIPFEDSITIQRLASEPSVILTRRDHPLIAGAAPPMAYIDYPWVLPAFPGNNFLRVPEPYRSEMVRRGFPTIILESFGACLDLVRRSDVVMGAPLSFGLAAQEAGGIDMVTFPFIAETGYAILRLRNRSLSPAAHAFAEALAQAARSAASHARVAEFRGRQRGTTLYTP